MNIMDNTKRNYNETRRQHVWNGKKQQALYVDAVLALVKGTGLAICRVATHAQAVSTLRGGRDLHVLKYEPVARLDAEREP